ncbi:MAG TPA: YnfA family protein [Acidimicrobiia bacterium]|nr:YnfA family protein [Acidimicrobiia bacterium]
MTVLRSLILFGAAALAEIGGSYLVWLGLRERRGLAFIGLGIAASGLYALFAALQPYPHFGRILAAYGGIFIAASLVWGMVFDGFRPDRYDLTGASICLIGVAVIMYAPRG